METKLDEKRMTRVQQRCGFINGLDVGADGFRGRLSLAWNEIELINIRSFSRNHKDVDIHEIKENLKWRLTGFYGASNIRNREDSWSLIRRLRRNDDSPWIVCCNFNEILYYHEKVGGIPREERCMGSF